MTIIHYIVLVSLILLSIAITWALTKYYYMKIINAMTIKNQAFIDRVKRTESIMINDILQLSPEDLTLLSEKIKEPKSKEK